VRPVNLLPEQYRARRPSAQAAGSSRIVIGVLGALLVMAVAYALTANQVNSRKTDISAAKSETQRAQAEAKSQGAFGTFHTMKQTRDLSVKQLAGGRFDWERLMREVALVLPKRTWVLDMTASTSAEGTTGTAGSSPPPPTTTSSSTGATGAAGSTAATSPSVHLLGCAFHQDAVAVVLVRLRKLDRATDVKLTESIKEKEQGGAQAQVATDAAGGGSQSCGGGRFKFDVTVTFSAPTPADLEREGHVRSALGGGS
jgi:type II secretory pathway pseudopilin PulG